MENPRLAAALTLILMLVGFGWLVATAIGSFPYGLIAVVLIAVGLECAWEALRRAEMTQTVFSVFAVACLVAALLAMLRGGLILDLVFVVVTLTGSSLLAKLVFRPRVRLPTALRPNRPVVLWNPNSGGGKAKAADLPGEARSRGIEPIELSPGDDLEQLARQAVTNGADALAAAGGDGTQAIVASVASEHDLPFACIPAGTRNHFALDLGVDRDDVVGALDAFVDGGERRVDLADVNGRVFVNNVSIGIYADAVQKQEYRAAKLRTIMETASEDIGEQSPRHELNWIGPTGAEHSSAAMILVSNNNYRIGLMLGSGTRPRIDDGELGIIALAGPHDRAESGRQGRLPWVQWTAPDFELRSNASVPVGVDGEAAVLDAPLRFAIRPGALRVRIAPQHPGASPSAAQPEGLRDGVWMLIRIAAGSDPADVFAHR